MHIIEIYEFKKEMGLDSDLYKSSALYKIEFKAFTSKVWVLWYPEPKWKSGLPVKLPELHTAMEIKPYVSYQGPCRKLFVLELLLPTVIGAGNSSFLCVLLII